MEAEPRGGGGPVWGWFGAWALVGGGAAFALLGALTIGVFILPVVLFAAFLLSRVREARLALLGLVSGLGLPLFYVAWLNRAGPGTVCHAIHGGTQCDQESSPWPWLVVGIILVIAGLGGQQWRVRRDERLHS